MGLRVNGISYKKSEIASFDVDPEKTFTPLCPGELPIPGGDLIVTELNYQATFANKRVGSKDAHSLGAIYNATEKQPQFSPIIDEPNADIRWNRHGIIGTFGFELIDGLPKVTEYDYFVWKGIELNLHPYGACYHDLHGKMSTGVIEYLKINGIKLVIIGGLALDYCVKTTAIQLAKAGFKVLVNTSACKGIANNTIEAALDEMVKAGCEIVDSEILKLFSFSDK